MITVEVQTCSLCVVQEERLSESVDPVAYRIVLCSGDEAVDTNCAGLSGVDAFEKDVEAVHASHPPFVNRRGVRLCF